MIALLVGSWRLLRSNPLILGPTLTLAIVAGLIDAFAPRASDAIGPGIQLAIAALAMGYATVAWQRGRVELRDGYEPLQAVLVQLILVCVALIVLVLAALVLTPFTYGAVDVLLLFVALYAVPGVVAGGRTAFAALDQSVRLAGQHLGLTAMIVAFVLVTGLLGFGLQAGCAHIAYAGAAIGNAVGAIVTIAQTFVIVGAYQSLTGSSSREAAKASANPAA